MMKKYLFAALVMGISLMNVFAEEAAKTEATNEVSAAGKYPLTVCPISGETLGEMGDPVVKVYDGREVKFCCKNCVGTFEKDLASSMKILDEKIVAAGKASYPLGTCVVSGEKLGGMGEPVVHMYKNRMVEFCCANCISTFEKDPDKYLAMIDAAAKPVEEKTEGEHKE